MSSSRQLLFLLAFATLIVACAAARAAPAPSIQYEILAPDAAGHAVVGCKTGSSAACVFWIGDPRIDVYRVVRVNVGDSRVLKEAAARQSYCVDVVDRGRPAWPGCVRTPLGGQLDHAGEALFVEP